MERIILLSLGFGTGHNAAAKALETEFCRYPGVITETIDLLELIPPTFHPLFQSGYQGMLVKFPSLYHLLYDWTYQFRLVRYVSKEFVGKIGLTIRRKVKAHLERFQPTKIVTTHPFSLLLVPSEWEHVPTVGVVTDYELHPMWLVELPDTLCVPKKLLKRKVLDRLRWKSGSRVLETGLPIDPKYYQELCKVEARQKLDLPTYEPVILVMGGGLGLGPLEQVVDELSSISYMQFVILTGSNETLYERLQRQGYGPHIRIEGFRSDMELFMTSADLLVTKPGGVTITEALAKRLPMLLFEAFPGQEQANQQYLVHHRIAFKTRPSTVCLQIEKFFHPRFLGQKLYERFDPLISPDAAQRIVHATLTTERSKVLV